jgi:hypothetical protein
MFSAKPTTTKKMTIAPIVVMVFMDISSAEKWRLPN